MPTDPQPQFSPALWHEPAPHHFDQAIPWWIKSLLLIAAILTAMFCLDQPIAAWTLANHPIDSGGAWHLKGDLIRELAMLEQWGQWVCSVLVIAAVALIDKLGRRRALAIALGCILTVLLTYLLKDLFGRSRPYVLNTGDWQWGGPRIGFTAGSAWNSFPSAHTSGAFALSAGLAWFYPKARALFMTLALITAIQRVLHSAHFLSDVLAGMTLAVFTTRLTLQSKLPGHLLNLLPIPLRTWFLNQNP